MIRYEGNKQRDAVENYVGGKVIREGLSEKVVNNWGLKIRRL